MYQESLNTHQTDSEEQKISSTQNQFDDAKNFVKYPNILIKNEKLYLPHILPIYSYLYSKINPSHELDITLQLIKDNFIKRSAQIYSKNEEYLKGLTFFTLNIKKETKPTIEIAPLIKIKELKEYIPNEPIPYDTTITQINKIVDKITKNNRVFISPPNCRATPEVVQAIKEADCIVIGPGSLYTNVIPNLLVNGVYKAMKDSKAIKIYVSNIMTEPGQTDNYSLADHIKAIIEHTGKNVIDYCIYDTGEIIPEYIKRYNLKGSELVAQDVAKARTLGVRLLQRDLACIENGYIRHNPELVARAISELICDDLKYRDKQSDPQYMLLKSKLEYEKQFNKIKNKPKRKRKTNENKKERKSKFLSKYGKRIEAMRNTEEVKLKNREILQNENKDKEEEFIEKFIEKVEQNKKK